MSSRRRRLPISLLLAAMAAACTDTPTTTAPRAARNAPRLAAIAAVGGITDLGTLGGNASEASAINNSGQVVGYANDVGNEHRAFLYTPGSPLVDLGTLGGTYAHAYGINDAGYVVGTSYNAAGLERAFLYPPGGPMVDLGTLGGPTSGAHAINAAGQVVGWSTTAGGGGHAFLWTPGPGGGLPGTMQDLGSMAGGFGGAFFVAFGINDVGQVTGPAYDDVDPTFHGHFVTPSIGAASAVDVGTLGVIQSLSFAINDARQVVGYSTVPAMVEHPFLYDPAVSGLLDLGTLGSYAAGGSPPEDYGFAYGMNDASPLVIVGRSSLPTGYGGAFRYIHGVGMGFLGFLPGGINSGATAVNDAGQVVGWSDGAGTGGFNRAVIWDANAPVNYVPTALAAGPSSAGVGDAVPFSGAGSSDPEGAPLTYTWSFGDGSTLGSGDTPSHTYTTAGTYTVILTVSDGELNATSMTTILISGAALAVDVGPDQTRPNGRSTLITPTITDAGGVGGPWSYTIDWGDGSALLTRTATAAGPQPTALHNYGPGGPYTVNLTLTGPGGGTASDAAVITMVPNSPPVAVVNGPYTGVEGTAVCFSSAGTSDADNEPLTYAWTSGDGGHPAGPSPCRTYKDDDVFTLTLTVTDRSGATSTASTTVTIANVAPTATFGAPTQVSEGVAQTLALTGGTDRGADDRPTLEYAFDCGQGAGPTPWSTSVTSVICAAFEDQGPPVTLRGLIRDDEGAETIYQRTLTVSNAPPVVTLAATSPTTFAAGGTLAVQGSFTDKGATDQPWAYSIRWGDGSATTGSVAVQGALPPAGHVYAAAGTYRASLIVTDKDGRAVTSTQLVVTVTP